MTVCFQRKEGTDVVSENITLVFLLLVLFVFAVVVSVLYCRHEQVCGSLSKVQSENANFRKLFQLLDECLFEYSYTKDCMYLENNEILFCGVHEVENFLSNENYVFQSETEEAAVAILRDVIRNRKTEEEASLIVDGEMHWYYLRMRFVAEDYVVGSIADISDLTREKQRMRELATTDSLTGLNNRYSNGILLKQYLEQEKKDGVYLLIDLDNFKTVNDRLGHEHGDCLLREMGHYLKKRYPDPNITARLGGDEFVVLLRDSYSEEALEHELTDMLHDLDEKVFARYREFGVSASIGAAPIRDHIVSVDDVYKEADSAMYVAKYTGKNNYFINDGNTCMRTTCIHCRTDCKRGKMISAFQNPDQHQGLDQNQNQDQNHDQDQKEEADSADQLRGGVKFCLLFPDGSTFQTKIEKRLS